MEECGLQFFTFEQAHSRPYRSELRRLYKMDLTEAVRFIDELALDNKP